MLKGYTNQQKIESYFILGGIPQYLKKFNTQQTVDENIIEFIIDSIFFSTHFTPLRKSFSFILLLFLQRSMDIDYFVRILFTCQSCIDIIPITSQYKAANKLVQKAKSTMGNNSYYPDEGTKPAFELRSKKYIF